jgi:TPR repeat protein
VEKNLVAAMDMFRKAADLGEADATASVGVMFERGHGVAQDQKVACEWYTKAASLGSAIAMHNLMCYYQGEGVAQDKSQALRWLRKSAAAGFELAKRKLEKLSFDTWTRLKATIM